MELPMKHTILLDNGTYLQVNDMGWTERKTPRQYKNLAEAQHHLKWGIGMCHTNVQLRTDRIAAYHKDKAKFEKAVAKEQALIKQLETQPYNKVADQIKKAHFNIDQLTVKFYPESRLADFKRDTKFLASAKQVLANNPRVIPLG
jgi:hypothetical protein